MHLLESNALKDVVWRLTVETRFKEEKSFNFSSTQQMSCRIVSLKVEAVFYFQTKGRK